MITLLHTSDWHLGRVLAQKSLLDDQRWVLEKRFIPLLDRAKPDVVIVAGDVYDRQVPGQEAVELLNDVLREVVLSRQIPVVLIAGNHDSGIRLDFASDLLRRSGLHIAGRASASPLVVSLPAKPVSLVAVPYFDPVEMRVLLGKQDIDDHNTALRIYLEHIKNTLPAGSMKVFVGHLFIQGGRVSESERILATGKTEDVGGAGQVDGNLLKDWDFAAFGHLHTPQQPGDRINYSGSLLQYGFKEPADKSATVVQLEQGREPDLQRIALEPHHPLRVIRGGFDALLADATADNQREDYLRIEYEAEHPIPFVMERLREKYPNVLEVVRTTADAKTGGVPDVGIAHVQNLGLAELLQSFCETVLTDGMSDERREIVSGVAVAAESKEQGGEA